MGENAVPGNSRDKMDQEKMEREKGENEEQKRKDIVNFF